MAAGTVFRADWTYPLSRRRAHFDRLCRDRKTMSVSAPAFSASLGKYSSAPLSPRALTLEVFMTQFFRRIGTGHSTWVDYVREPIYTDIPVYAMLPDPGSLGRWPSAFDRGRFGGRRPPRQPLRGRVRRAGNAPSSLIRVLKTSCACKGCDPYHHQALLQNLLLFQNPSGDYRHECRTVPLGEVNEVGGGSQGSSPGNQVLKRLGKWNDLDKV